MLQVATVAEIVLFCSERLYMVSGHVSVFIFVLLWYDNVCQRFWSQKFKLLFSSYVLFSFFYLFMLTKILNALNFVVANYESLKDPSCINLPRGSYRGPRVAYKKLY